VREWLHAGAHYANSADQFIIFQHGDEQIAPDAYPFHESHQAGYALEITLICRQVGDVDRRLGFDHSRGGSAFTDWIEVALDIVRICHTCSRNTAIAVFLEEYQGAHFGSTEAGGIGGYCVEDRLQLVRRVGNGAQYFRHRRLLRSEFGYLLLQLQAIGNTPATRGFRAAAGLDLFHLVTSPSVANGTVLIPSLKRRAAMCEHHEPFEPEKCDRTSEVRAGSKIEVAVRPRYFCFPPMHGHPET